MPMPLTFSRLGLVLAVLALLSACASQAPTGVAEVLDRPAERQLVSGLRLYDDAQYKDAEAALKEALRLELASPRDRATAHKTLAFIYCTSQRQADCEAAFRAARAADPQFQLSKSEQGHPLWAPVYQRSLR